MATPQYRLILPSTFRTLQYRKLHLQPNPYTTQGRPLGRENLPAETYWTGYERRPGMADLRPVILERDNYTCQRCGAHTTAHTAQVDHIRPARRFRRPIDANGPDNLWTLCIACHRAKTASDRRMESRVR